MKCRSVLAWLILSSTLSFSALPQADPSGITVNDVELTVQQVQYYQLWVPAGSYWYDRVSGLWGTKGGPTEGQIAANLDIGGSLKQDASGSRTGILINGREIHVQEVQYLSMVLNQVIPPGRYWLRHDGVGGSEGGPATFSLPEYDPGGGNGSGRTFEDEFDDFCARNGGCS